ncbi:MAG TPA: hypothetical protein DCZ80_00870, partial [Legionellales bacterium]|nr:hypothetical protein [Legionellales bacterium]
FSGDLSSEPLFVKINNSPSKKDIKVLILGGSLAAQLSHESLLYNRLNERFGTDRFSVYNAGIG